MLGLPRKVRKGVRKRLGYVKVTLTHVRGITRSASAQRMKVMSSMLGRVKLTHPVTRNRNPTLILKNQKYGRGREGYLLSSCFIMSLSIELFYGFLVAKLVCCKLLCLPIRQSLLWK